MRFVLRLILASSLAMLWAGIGISLEADPKQLTHTVSINPSGTTEVVFGDTNVTYKATCTGGSDHKKGHRVLAEGKADSPLWRPRKDGWESRLDRNSGEISKRRH